MTEAQVRSLEDILDATSFEDVIRALAQIARENADASHALFVIPETTVLWESRRRECLETLHRLKPIVVELEVDAETA